MHVTIRMEWDMGHRLPNHAGQCRYLHGHRYVVEATVAGAASAIPGQPDEGMVVDFAVAKRILRRELTKLDHRFLVCERDPLAEALAAMPGVVCVPFVPTVERIAEALLGALRIGQPSTAPYFSTLRVYETPTSWVEVS